MNGNYYQKLENDPRFAKLPYDEQIRLRAEVLKKQLQLDPKFAQLPPEQKQLLFDKLIFAAPRFEPSPELFGIKGLTPDFGAMNLLKEKIDKQGAVGMQEHFEKLMLTRESPTRAGAIIKDVTKLLGQASRFGAGFYEGTGLIKAFNGLLQRATQTEAIGRNQEKFLDWLRYTQNKDMKQASLGSVLETAGMISGFGLETSIGYTGLVGTMAKPAGVAKLLMKIPKIAKLPRWGYLAARSGVHAAAGGVVGVLREDLKDIMNRGWENKSFQEIAFKSASYFGEYALGDLACFFVLGGLKRGGQALKWTFKGPPKEISLVSEASAGKPLQNLRASFNNAFVDAVSGGGYSRAFIEKFGDEQLTTMFNIAESHGRVLRFAGKPDPDDLLRTYGMALGPDNAVAMKKAASGAWNATDPLTGKLVKHLKDYDSAKAFLDERALQLPKTKTRDAGMMAVGSRKLQISETVKQYLPDNAKEKAKLLSATVAPVGGKFNRKNVEMFAKEFYRGTDIDRETVRVLSSGDKLVVQVGNRSISEVPAAISNPLDEVDAIAKLSRDLGKMTKHPGVGAGGPEIQQAYQEMLKKSQVHYTPSWIVDTALNDFGANIEQVAGGKLRVAFPGQAAQMFDSIEDVGNFILKNKIIDDKLVKTYLATYQGLDLQKTNRGYLVYKGGVKVAQAESIDELLRNNPELTPKIPAEYAPEFTFLVDKDFTGTGGVVQQNKIAFGTAETLMEELDKYSKYSTRQAKQARLGNRVRFDRETSVYTVDVPELGFSREFKSLEAAKKFLKRGANDYDIVRKAAERKGYNIEVRDNQWWVYNKDRVLTARSKKELMGIIREAPLAEYMPELTGIEEAWFRDMRRVPDLSTGDTKWKLEPGEVAEMSAGWNLKNFLWPTEISFENAVKQGAPEYILKSMRRIEAGRGFVMGTFADADKIASTAFKIDGKTMKKAERIRFGELLRNNLDDPGIREIAEGLGLTAEHIDAAKNVRTMYNQLFQLYDINADKFLTEYLPKIKLYRKTAEMGKYFDSDTVDFLKDAFKTDRLPTDVDAFFRHSRVSDIVDFALEDDPLIQLRKYIAAGQRERFLGPILDDVDKWFKANSGQYDPALRTRFKIYMQEFAGIPGDLNEELVRTFSHRLFKGIGVKHNPSSVVDAVLQLGYMSGLGFRPGTALRNLTQPFLTTGTRIGQSWVADAMDLLAKDKTGEVAALIRKSGIIPPDLPFYKSGEIFGRGGKLEKTSQATLRWIKTSDTWNRSVSYMASRLRFDDALKRYNAGAIDLDRFLKRDSGVWNLADDLQARCRQHMLEGKPELARELFAVQMVRETQFDYKAGLMPVWAKGTMGKVFGQFGTYPTYFVANIRNGFMRARTLGQKAAFVSRWVGTGLAFSAAASYIGMRTEDYFPGPLTFSGGPYYHLLNDFMEAFSNSPDAPQIRARLFGYTTKNGQPQIDIGKLMNSTLLTSVVPGSYQFRSIVRGLEYANAGDLHKAFLSWTSVPIDKNQQ